MWLFLISWTVKNFKNTKTSFPLFAFVESFLNFFFFFFLWNPHFYFYWNIWRDVQKNTYIQPKKLDYDDSFGADISSICTASIFIRIDLFSLFVYVRIISIPLIRLYIQISKYICQIKIFFRLFNVIITFREDILHIRNANMHEFLQAKYSCSISFRLNKFVYLLFFLFFTFKSLLMRFLYRMHQ